VAPAPEPPADRPRGQGESSTTFRSAQRSARSSGPKFGHRLTLDVDNPMYEMLRDAVLQDGVPVAIRLRALLEVWQSDDKLQARVRKMGHDAIRAARP
jgi:hypothetical protein